MFLIVFKRKKVLIESRIKMKLINLVHITFVIVTMFLIIHGNDFKKPSVLIAILVRNKAHTLPYFLTFLEQLNYPKPRIHLW